MKQSVCTAEDYVPLHEMSVRRARFGVTDSFVWFGQFDGRVSTGGSPHHQSVLKQNNFSLRVSD
jgi:hypothetical protein